MDLREWIRFGFKKSKKKQYYFSIHCFTVH
jgi:hypothetical protein